MNLLAYIREGKALSGKQKMRLVVALSLPSIMAQITSIIMQYIDAAMVGHLGANASAAIGLVATSTWLFGGMCTSAVSGFSIQVAQYIGAKRYKRAREVLWQSYFVVIGIALCMSLLGLSMARQLPKWLGGDLVLWKEASEYFIIYACSLPFMAVNSLAGAMLQCSGNMKIPGILNSFLCILDMVFNAFFIFDSGTIAMGGMNIPHFGLGLGVMGAAMGTTMAEIVVMCLMLYFLWKRTPLLRSNKPQKHHFYKKDNIRAIKLSLPIAFEHFVVCGAMIVTTGIVAPLGVVAIAANSFAITVESVCYMPAYGFAEAGTTLIGQSIGAQRKKLAFSFGKIVICSGMLLMVIMGTIMYLAAPWMIGLLTPDISVRNLGVRILRIEAFAEPFYGASIVVTGVLRGAGDTFIPSVLNFISLWCVRLPLSFWLAKDYGLVGVWIAMCTELCVRGLLFLFRFGRRKWLKL